VTPTDTFTYYGMVGTAAGGAGSNSGVFGNATGAGTNYGIRGTAYGGEYNYAIFGGVDTSGVHGTYAGYFEGDVHIRNKLGIGTVDPVHILHVTGNSGAALQPIAMFENTCDTVEGQLVDAFGVMGKCDNVDWAGYGGNFRGGFVGVRGEVFPAANHTYFGVRGTVTGGTGSNYGVHGYANGDGTNTGVRGRADGSNANQGLWGYATGGSTNYAIYGVVDTTGVEGTYAGYFSGDTYVSGRLGIGATAPGAKLDIRGDTSQQLAYFGDDLDDHSYITIFKATHFTAGKDVGVVFGGRNDGQHHLNSNDLRAGIFGAYDGDLYLTARHQNPVNDDPRAYARLWVDGESGHVGIGTTSPKSQLHVDGGVQIADDSNTASVDKVGTLRYRADSNHSYVEMCMQTGVSTYTWIVITENAW